MITIDKKESIQFQYITPAKGSLETLELVNQILQKVNFDENDGNLKDIELTEKELCFLVEMINLLDSERLLHINSLSLIKKILKEKESIKNG